MIKGGVLISSIIGINHRTTMDIDTTIRNISLNEEYIVKATKEICQKDVDDNISFKYDGIEPIRDDDKYGGFRVTIYAKFGKINTPITMDVSAGDVITPDANRHTFVDIIDGTEFDLFSYPIETVLAEKLETILSRGTENTRPRDFYDIYSLSANNWDSRILSNAFKATSTHRGSYDKILDTKNIIEDIRKSKELKMRWDNYRKRLNYAKEIEFEDTIKVMEKMIGQIENVGFSDKSM